MSAFHEGRRIVHLTLDLEGLDTSYPFVITLPQGQTERVLIDVLKSRGGSVEWKTKLTRFLKSDANVRATLTGPDGTEQDVRARWLIGCDGARSVVRHTLNLPFQGTEYEETFYLADVRIDWDQPDDEAMLIISQEVQLGAFPLPAPGRWRLVDPSSAVGTDDPPKAAEPSRACSIPTGSPRPASATRSGSPRFACTAARSIGFAWATVWSPETRRTSTVRREGRG